MFYSNSSCGIRQEHQRGLCCDAESLFTNDVLKQAISSAGPPQTFPFPRNEDVIVREEVFSKLSLLFSD